MTETAKEFLTGFGKVLAIGFAVLCFLFLLFFRGIFIPHEEGTMTAGEFLRTLHENYTIRDLEAEALIRLGMTREEVLPERTKKARELQQEKMRGKEVLNGVLEEIDPLALLDDLEEVRN